MENDKREYKERKPFDKQIFYFNDKGQLVVESNKGVWVDGEKFVKMYGDFVCNAKTMGEIIHQLKGIPVEIGEIKYVKDEYLEHNYFGDITYEDKYVESNTCCVLGVSDERIKEFEAQYAVETLTNNEIQYLERKIKDRDDAIENFNRLHWWKRMFKKIEVK